MPLLFGCLKGKLAAKQSTGKSQEVAAVRSQPGAHKKGNPASFRAECETARLFLPFVMVSSVCLFWSFVVGGETLGWRTVNKPLHAAYLMV